MASPGIVHLIYGPQGAGKSTFAAQLSARTGAVVFGIDAWMLGLFMPDLPALPSLDWISERTQRCEQVIWSICLQTTALGTDVVLDLGLLRQADRQRVRALAEGAGLELRASCIEAPRELRWERVQARNADQGETFSFMVTPQMFDFMEAVYEAPDETERRLSLGGKA